MPKLKEKPQAWPADKVERRKVADLIPYARNARTHSETQVSQIAASIKEWGWTTPVLIDEDGGIIAGHGRVMAAQKLGIDDVPAMTATGWTEAQKKAYVLADNQLALNAGWDMDLLKVELAELDDLDFDVDLIGFDGKFLADLLNDPMEGLTDPDDAPSETEAISVAGDTWILGEHRIRCGSSMKEDDVVALMDGRKADVVFTDPPYGVSYVGSGKSGSIAGDISQAAIPISFKMAIDHATTDNARLYFCGGSNNVSMYYALWDAHLRSMPALIIWDKGSIVLRRNNYHSQYEVIFYGWKGSGGDGKYWFGGRKQDEASDIWQVKRDNGKDYVHPTQKPTDLPARAIANSCPPGGVVFEPFSGSGSTLIASEKTGRTCCAMELDPRFVDVAVKRWQDFTGKEAVHEQSGKTFEEVSNGRS